MANLTNCIRNAKLPADEATAIREAAKAAGDPIKGVTEVLDSIEDNLEELRNNLVAKGFDLARRELAPVEESQPEGAPAERPAFDPAMHTQLIADTPEQIRRQDLVRLFEEAPRDADAWHDLRVYLYEKRPDLGADILEAIGEAGGYPKDPAAEAEKERIRKETFERQKAKGEQIEARLQAGGKVVLRTQTKATEYTDPQDVRVTVGGVNFRVGNGWVTATEDQLNDMLAQTTAKTEKVQTVDGKRDQFVLGGAEQSAKQAAQAREVAGKGKLKAKAPQQDAGGMFAEPDRQTDIFSQAPAPKKPEEPGKVEDVGENLKYNRRNFTAGGLSWEQLQEMNPALRIREAVKSKIWPKPNYQALIDDGMPAIAARAVKQVYDGMGSAPPKTDDESLKLYADTLAKVRAATIAWASDPARLQQWKDSATALMSSMSGGRVSLIEMAGAERRAAVDSLLRAIWPEEMAKSSYGRWKRGTEAGDEIRILGGNRALKAMQVTMDDVLGFNKEISEEGWPTPQEAWQRQGLEILDVAKEARVAEGTAYGKDGSRTPVFRIILGTRYSSPAMPETYPTREAAEQAKDALGNSYAVAKGSQFIGTFKTQAEATEGARAAVKRGGSAAGGDIRGMNITESERTGPERREAGRNVTAQDVMETFGFRGVNFGREGWMNQNERQIAINAAFDALHDLAVLLDVPPKALSLNGELGIAFGAQGRGGKNAAHFVPGLNEINLTKTAGAGTLAHEWGHALDHYFATQAGLERKSAPYMSETVGAPVSGIRPEIREAFDDIVKAMMKRPMTPEEMANARQEREAKAVRNLDSWIRSIRRDLEKTPEALEPFDKLADRMRAGDKGEGLRLSGKLPLHDVVAQMRDLVMATLGKSSVASVTDTWKSLDSNASHVAFIKNQDQAEKSHVSQTPTDYKKASEAADKGKSGKAYWGTPREMFARAFELWTADKLAANAQSNTFLTDAALREQRKTPQGGNAFPYPRGLDRETINAAITKLVAAIETKETGKGTAMFSLRRGAQRRPVQIINRQGAWRILVDGEYFLGPEFKTKPDAVAWASENKDKVNAAPNAQMSLRRERPAEEVDTKTAAFKRWFEGSKVVDVDGKPLQVYHGTSDPFEAFDPAKVGSQHVDLEEGDAFFFTDDPATADWYANSSAETSGEGAHVRPVYLALKNPLIVDFQETGIEFLAEDVARAKEEGRDGVIAYNYDDGTISTHYIAFRPEQIKSVFNQGTWSPTDKRISYALRSPQARRHGIPPKAAVITSFKDDAEMKAHPDYRAAKAGDPSAAVKVVRDLVSDEKLAEARARFGADVIYVPVIAQEMTGVNQLPTSLAGLYAAATGATTTHDIHQVTKAWHTGARPLERIMSRPVFDGPVQPGKRYVIVDDATVLGGTLAELASHIQAGGGIVEGMVTLVNASRSGVYTPKKLHIQAIEARFGDEIRNLGIEPNALTADEATYLLGFRDADGLRAAVAKAQSERGQRLRSKGLRAPEDEGQLRLSDPTAEFVQAVAPNLRDDLTAALRKMDPRGRIALRLVPKIEAWVNGQLSQADGQYMGRLIEVALDASDKGWVLNHEAIHALRDLGVIAPDEWRALVRAAQANTARMANIRDVYEEAYRERFPEDFEDKILEEAVADMFADWQKGELDAHGFQRSAMERVRAFFRALADFFRGKGFNTPERVFGRIASGEIGARDLEGERETAGDGMFSKAGSIDSKAFKNWFGESKVVGTDGKPRIMYHGTSKSENGQAFSTFDTYASQYGLMGQGGYFTADPQVASSYTAKGRGENPSVYPVYLSIKNPLDMDADANVEEWKKAFGDDIAEFHEGGSTNESWYRAAEETTMQEGLPQWEGAERMQDGIRSMGFDGITHIGGGRRDAGSVRHRVFIAFDPEQVKSVYNRGTWNPNDSNIRYSMRSAAAAPFSLRRSLFGRGEKTEVPAPAPATAPAKTEEKVGIKADLGGLMSVLGSKLYDAKMPQVTVKELLQNSWDGIKGAMATGRLKPGEGHINIKLDDEHRTITFTDNGMGMSPQVVKDALLTIAGTSKEGLSTAERSGGFGIAKMGSILAGDRMRLTTIRDGVKTTLNTTRSALLKGEATLKSDTTTDPNGTAIEITVPQQAPTAAGTMEDMRFPLDEYAYSILKSPLIGDVGVSFTTRKKTWDNKYEEKTSQLAIGRNQDLKGAEKVTTAHFPWGDIDIYMSGPLNESYPDHDVLSSGIHQFGSAVTTHAGSWDRIPHRFIFNVKPKVEAHAHNYPFNNQREGWAEAVKPDLEAMKNYLRNIYNTRKANETKLGYVDVSLMPRMSLDMTADEVRSGGDEFAYEDAGLRDSLPNPPSQMQPVPEITIRDGKRVGAETSNGWDAAGDVTYEPAKIGDLSIPPERLDVTRPYFHNGLNIDLFKRAAEISNVPEPALRYFVARLGTIVHNFATGLGKVPKYSMFATDKRPVGISFAKAYQGVNIKVPYRGIFLQPFGQFAKDADGTTSLANLFKHIMIHEAVHEHVSGHNEAFTSGEAELYAQYDKYAGDGALDDIYSDLKNLIREHRDAYDALARAYDEPATKDAPGATEGGESAAVFGGPEGRSQLRENEDDRVRPEGRGEAGGGDAGVAGTRRGSADADLGRVASKPLLSLRRGTVRQERAINKAIAPRDGRTIGQRIAEAYNDLKTRLVDEFTWAVADEFHGLRKMGKTLMPKAADRELGSYVGARLARHAAGQIEAFLRWGAPVWDDQTAVLEQDGTGGLYQIIEPVYRNGLERLFDGYAYARRVRTQGLIADEREKNLTEAEVDELLALGNEHPEIVEAFNKIQAYKKKVLDAVQSMGLINAEQRSVWEKADHVPFYRATGEEGGASGPSRKRGLANQSAGIRRLTGRGETFAVINDTTGEVVDRFETEAEANAELTRRGAGFSVEAAGEPIAGVVENIARNITHLLDSAMKNHAAVLAIDEALDLGWAEKVPMAIGQALVPLTSMAKTLENQGIQVGKGAEGVAAVMAIMPPVKPGNDVVAIRRDGVTEYYKVEDKLVYRSLAGLYRTQMSSFIKPLAEIKNLLTRTVTAMPGFMVRNFVRDSAASWLISEERGLNFYKEMAKSVAALATRMDDPKTRALMAAGGDTGFYQNAPEDVVKQLRSMEARGQVRLLRWADPRNLLHSYMELGRASELANRRVTFASEMERSGNTRQAAFSAADLLDFQLKGGSDFIQALTAIVPFLNARIQGLYKLGRAGTSKSPSERKSFAAKAAMMVAFSLALMALNAGDDDDDGYNDLHEWVKDRSWVVNNYRLFGKETAQAVGLPRFFLIPKPFELGVLFGTMPERIVQLAAGNDRTKDTWKSVYTALLSTFEFNPLGNPVTKEIMEQWANKDLFTGMPIVSQAVEHLPPEQQYNAGTSEIAKWLGEKIGVSPARIEHVVKGFTGTLGTYVMAAADATGRALGVTPPRPTQRMDQMEIIRSFVSTDPAIGTKWSERFYELTARAGEVYDGARALAKEGDNNGAHDLAQQHRGLLGARKAMNRTADDLSDIRKEMKEIRRSLKMSPDEKRRRLDELTARQNQIVKKAAKAVERLSGE